MITGANGLVREQPDPVDFKTICGSESSDIQEAIRDACESNARAALEAYADICSENGHSVST